MPHRIKFQKHAHPLLIVSASVTQRVRIRCSTCPHPFAIDCALIWPQFIGILVFIMALLGMRAAYIPQHHAAFFAGCRMDDTFSYAGFPE